jgi:hypothetical protein
MDPYARVPGTPAALLATFRDSNSAAQERRKPNEDAPSRRDRIERKWQSIRNELVMVR